MKPELRAFTHQSLLDQRSLQHVIANLPTDDAELDREIEAALDGDQPNEFKFLSLAALAAERPVDARHLVKGIAMLDRTNCLPEVALRMRGDVGGYLVKGVEAAFMDREISAQALCLAAVWCAEHRDGAFPEGLIPEARQIARDQRVAPSTIGYLVAIVINTKDKGLLSLLQNRLPQVPKEAWKVMMEAAIPLTRLLLERGKGSILERVREIDTSVNIPGTTMRRAAVRVGRNEPCPCGSGRKYKHCCYQKDQERVQHSSEISGVTREEFQANPALFLTAARLDAMPVSLLARMNPAEVPRLLHADYLMKLAANKRYDEAAAAFEQIGYRDELYEAWRTLLFLSVVREQRVLAERLFRLHPREALKERDFSLAIDLLLQDNNPGRCLELIEQQAVAALRAEDEGRVEESMEFAFSMAYSRFPALGILVNRAALPLSQASDWFSMLSDRLLQIRDQLSLAPEDSSIALVHDLSRKSLNKEETAAEIATARREADTQRARFREVQEALRQLELKNKRYERIASRPETPAPEAASQDDREKGLRRRIDLLMEEVKAEHSAKNMYRRKYEESQKIMEERRAEAESNEPPQSGLQAAAEDDLLLPEELERNEPVRVIEFPRNFQQYLTGFPRHVAKAAISALGGIAAGEPEAFADVRRIQRCPDVLRLRTGEYRLLFRLLPDHVQVIDLVSRQDFERRIKTLVSTP
jgi:SEC-C motif